MKKIKFIREGICSICNLGFKEITFKDTIGIVPNNICLNCFDKLKVLK